MKITKPIALSAAFCLAIAVLPSSAAALTDGDPPSGPVAANTPSTPPEAESPLTDPAQEPPDTDPGPENPGTGIEQNDPAEIAPIPQHPTDPANDLDFSAAPDIPIESGPTEILNYWVRPEGKYRDTSSVSGAVAINTDRLPTESHRSTEWDGLLRLAPGDRWASELQWRLAADSDQVCLAQSPAVPLHGEIVITTDQAITAADVRIETSAQARNLADLECTSGSFQPVAVVGVGAAENAEPYAAEDTDQRVPASRQSRRAGSADARYHRFAVLLPNAGSVAAVRVWINPVASGAAVTRVHQIDPAASAPAAEGLWTVAARSTGQDAATVDWQQASAPITAITGSELPATTKTSDVLFALTSADSTDEAVGSPAERETARRDAAETTESVDGEDQSETDDADAPADDAEVDDEEVADAAKQPDPAESSGKPNPSPEPEKSNPPVAMPDAGVASAAGFGLLTLTTLGFGGAVALAARHRKDQYRKTR